MKPTTPHDPLDDLIAAALHGEMTQEERTQFDARLRNEPATQAAYQKAQLMHDLLEKTHKNAQPDSSFEQRMVSGVRRKLQHEQHKETAWESLLVLWTSVKRFMPRRSLTQYGIGLAFISVISVSVLISMGNQVKSVFTTISGPLAYGGSGLDYRTPQLRVPQSESRLGDSPVVGRLFPNNNTSGIPVGVGGLVLSGQNVPVTAITGTGNTYTGGTVIDSGSLVVKSPTLNAGEYSTKTSNTPREKDLKKVIEAQGINYIETAKKGITLSGYVDTSRTEQFAGAPQNAPATPLHMPDVVNSGGLTSSTPAKTLATFNSNNRGDDNPIDRNGYAVDVTKAPPKRLIVRNDKDAEHKDSRDEQQIVADQLQAAQHQIHALKKTEGQDDAGLPVIPNGKGADKTEALAMDKPAPAIDTRKLIRNAQLDLEVKSYQTATDLIAALTKTDGGYVDTSSSQKGGNGKLQGTIIVKVLPQNLDSFLLKLRDLGQLRNQSVSTDDVTKDYFDTQARLTNSRKMEEQLQELLKRNNGKVSELLQVERELGRVRGEIEQMQGQLKLYDFQVQYATVTINMRETDLNQTAAYLLKENDVFSLFATNVEETFQQTRKAADDFKAHILSANLNHNSGSDVSATLVVSVLPDQIELFLAQLRGMGRVDNFTRETQRVPKDGGNPDQPADQTLTDKDKVIVNITIRSDDESRKQVAMTVVTAAVDTALDQAKTTALSNSGEILSSSLNKTPQGQSNGQLSIRVPGKNYHALLDAYRTLGRTASFSLQRDDNSGPGANGDDEPVIITLSLTDEETPLQQTEMSVLATDVDAQAQQLKKDATAYSVQVKASSFEREPNGMEVAQMTFRLPMSKYPAFVGNLKKLGHVESLSVNRVDRPDQTHTDDSAPAEISLRLHNRGDIVAEDDGIMATLRHTFGDGIGALFGSIRVIGILVAFVIPWVLAIGILAWVGRRIYVWKKK